MNSFDALTILARTCRLFYRYASQEMWHTLPSLELIFRTMPEDAYRRERIARPWEHACGRMKPTVTLKATRPLKPDDLARFRLYAPFIRRVAHRHSSDWGWRKASFVGAYTDYDVSPELWEMLQEIWPCDLRLELEVLVYRQYAQKAYAHPLHLLIVPSLKKLDLTMLYVNKRARIHPITQDPSLGVFFEQLPRLAPHITTFVFSTDLPIFARDPLSDSLCSLFQLTSVTVERTPLLPRALYHLSTLPALRRLDVRVPSLDDLVAEALPTGTFSALQDLKLHAVQIDECVCLLGHVYSSALHSIALDVQNPSSTGTFHALASEILAVPSSRTSISSLEFTLGWYEGLSPEAFDPLLPLSALEELLVNGSACATVDDATLRAMAWSWPRMQRLVLYDWLDARTPQHGIQATIHGLRHFAQCCPDLERLAVPLSNVSPTTFAFPASRNYPQVDPLRPHALKGLGVGLPELHDETAFAGYLSTLFPALTYIDHCWGVSPNGVLWGELTDEDRREEERWSALYGVFEAFVRLRAQEGSWRVAQSQSRLQGAFHSLSLV